MKHWLDAANAAGIARRQNSDSVVAIRARGPETAGTIPAAFGRNGRWSTISSAGRSSGNRPILMAVNISAIQFRDHNLANVVREVLTEMELPDECLELEMTETVAMGDPHSAIAIVEGLRRLGVRMSIDDFGTGDSSLNHLKKFSLDKLKIDKSFIGGIASSPEDRAIVKAIISLSRNPGLRTVAEGVETADEVAFLRDQGCDEAQGYYFCKRLPGSELPEYLRNHPAG